MFLVLCWIVRFFLMKIDWLLGVVVSLENLICRVGNSESGLCVLFLLCFVFFYEWYLKL